jgi:uracil-DNA glycosylase family 4
MNGTDGTDPGSHFGAEGAKGARARALAALGAEVEACAACPRLVAQRELVARQRRRAFRDQSYWGRPLMGFGDPAARLLLLGLAPAAHGGNRTGRMFTGDRSGDFLVAALWRQGFATQPTSVARDDGLCLVDAYMTAVVRCAPPANRPSAEEIAQCRRHLVRETALLAEVRVVLVLGRIAWDGFRALRRAQGRSVPRVAFGHGREERLPDDGLTVLASYHPSQQNTLTGRLTPAMLDAVLARARALLDADRLG